MKKKIFVLFGAADSGKTSTIEFVYRRLRDLQERLVEQVARRRGWVEVIGVILEVDGVTVGIDSRGDAPKYIDAALDPLIAHGCTIILCAAHPQTSRTYHMVWEKAHDSGYDVEYVRKEKSDGEEAELQRANQVAAGILLSKILDAVDSARLVTA